MWCRAFYAGMKIKTLKTLKSKCCLDSPGEEEKRHTATHTATHTHTHTHTPHARLPPVALQPQTVKQSSIFLCPVLQIPLRGEKSAKENYAHNETLSLQPAKIKSCRKGLPWKWQLRMLKHSSLVRHSGNQWLTDTRTGNLTRKGGVYCSSVVWTDMIEVWNPTKNEQEVVQ